MEFSLDPSSSSPLYRQLQEQVRYAISVGELRPGDRLPSIRDLEARLAVNRNTVRRAYQELHADGMLLLRRGREAEVAPRRPSGLMRSATQRAMSADELARLTLQQAEAEELDCIEFASHVALAARGHDRAYPRFAFVECSMRQATSLAEAAAKRLDRSVVPIELDVLRENADAIPASVRFVLSPHWHIAETIELLAPSGRTVFAIELIIAAECARRLRAIEDTRIGLVVRDVASLPGYRQLLRLHIGCRSVTGATLDDHAAISAMMRQVRHIACTPPCRELVEAAAPSEIAVHELIFEPDQEALDAVAVEIFPRIAALSQGAEPEQTPMEMHSQ